MQADVKEQLDEAYALLRTTDESQQEIGLKILINYANAVHNHRRTGASMELLPLAFVDSIVPLLRAPSQVRRSPLPLSYSISISRNQWHSMPHSRYSRGVPPCSIWVLVVLRICASTRWLAERDICSSLNISRHRSIDRSISRGSSPSALSVAITLEYHHLDTLVDVVIILSLVLCVAADLCLLISLTFARDIIIIAPLRYPSSSPPRLARFYYHYSTLQLLLLQLPLACHPRPSPFDIYICNVDGNRAIDTIKKLLVRSHSLA